MAKKTDTADSAPATNDAYTGMLVIALLALIVGTVFLYLDYQQYPDKAPSIPNTGFKAAPGPGGGEPKAPEPKGGEPKGNPMPPMPME